MADKTTEQEPSIEEILASIRQIISDDDGGAAQAAPAPKAEPAPAPEPEPVAAPAPAPKAAPVLDLTELAPSPPPQRIEIEMNDAVDEPEPEIEPEPVAAPEPAPPPPPAPKPAPQPVAAAPAAPDDPVLTNLAQRAAFEGFTKLTNQMAIDRQSRNSVTLEDIVRDMMKPMLREWLDANLPGLIEKLVQKELDRLANKALDE